MILKPVYLVLLFLLLGHAGFVFCNPIHFRLKLLIPTLFPFHIVPIPFWLHQYHQASNFGGLR